MGGSNSRAGGDIALPALQVVNQDGRRGMAPAQPPPRAQLPRQQPERLTELKMKQTWDKHSFRLERAVPGGSFSGQKHLWNLSAEFTTETPCQFAAHFNCQEQMVSSRLQFVAVEAGSPPAFEQSFPSGQHTVSLKGGRAIDTKRWPLEVFWKYRRGTNIMPIVFCLSTEEMQLVTYLSLEGRPVQCTVLRQKVVVGGAEYPIMEIYGLTQMTKDDAHDESSVGEPCVICLSEPRNTAVLPCRHLCVCEECAAHVRGDRCPICRADVHSIKVFGVQVQR